VSVFGATLHWFSDPTHWSGPDGVPVRVEEHALMSLAATATAVALALPLGLLIGHWGKGALLTVNVSNLGRAIPSFAILVIALQLVGIGAKPAFLALVALAIPPILTNAVTGISQVSPELTDAGRGLGMSEIRILTRVEIPNATPLIMAGVRNAGVQVVATATLAALVAWGGLGRYIVDGLYQRDDAQVFAGAVLVAIMAGAAEFALAALQWMVTPRGLRPKNSITLLRMGRGQSTISAQEGIGN